MTIAQAGVLHAADAPAVTHSFLALGAETRIIGSDRKIVWSYPRSTRDGFVLPSGNILLAVSKGKDFPGGGVVELTRDGKTVFEWKGTQSEVNTVQALANGNYMLTEAGAKPRILEVDREGKIVVEVPLSCQSTNHHMESRMARKLTNGNYLVPQLLDKIVREYTPAGKIAWEFWTPDEPKDSWPFTAIRLANGNTLITCTHGNMVIEVDKIGKIVWKISNDDLPAKLLNDPCGAQRLSNGNTVICSYAIGANHTKLVEVTPDKRVVWTYADEGKAGIHEVQIIETNGRPLEGAPLK
ncbi:MAG: hypothetical protein HY300_16750 [Verrucomicrobia bacterium]|nr:hypothetical protein [Verrucomicrobiota bacterium]